MYILSVLGLYYTPEFTYILPIIVKILQLEPMKLCEIEMLLKEKI